jgi:sulfate adenylyltransferase
VTVITTMPPHGGPLVSLLAEPDRAAELARRAARWTSWQLTPRQLCDLELLTCGGFSPLRTFLGQDDYRSVCGRMRLGDGTLWPIPVTLDVPEALLAAAGPGNMLALRDREGTLLAALHVTQAWRPDVAAEAAAVFGTTDPAHPGVDYLLRRDGHWYVSGELEAVQLPEHQDFRSFRHTPAQLREEFARRGWQRVIAFQTRNPMHRAHQELTLRALRETDAGLLIHPVVGVTKPGDIDPGIRVRCYQAILPGYPDGGALLSLLPLAMRMAGPREALWHAIIRKNYGATHLIVGRDHAGPSRGPGGPPFYPPYAAQELARRHGHELGMQVLTFPRLVYVADTGSYQPEDEAPPGAEVLTISGTQLRQRLADGEELPDWFMPPDVAAVLRHSYPQRTAAGPAARHMNGDTPLTAAEPFAERAGRDVPGRVLIIVENIPVAMDHRVMKQLDTLIRHGHDVCVITRKDARNEAYRAHRQVRLFEYPPPPEPRSLYGYLIEYGYSFLAAVLLSVRAFFSGRVDVVQFCQPPDMYFPLGWLFKRLGARVLIDQRDLLSELYTARYGGERTRFHAVLRRLERWSHRGADRIICVNEYLRKRALAASGLPADRVAVIRNGPVLDRVTRAPADESLRRGRQYLCCWVGVMGRQDRVDLLLRSIHHVVHDIGRHDCEFAIVGDGEYLAESRKLASDLSLDDWVHFTGWLPEDQVFRYLATADVGLDASLQVEVSPVKAMEYMAFGVPFVSFDLPETRAISEGAAVYVAAGDVEAHGRAVDRLLAEGTQRQALGAAGAVRVREDLSWENQARSYVQVIGQLCSGTGRAARPGRRLDSLRTGTP